MTRFFFALFAAAMLVTALPVFAQESTDPCAEYAISQGASQSAACVTSRSLCLETPYNESAGVTLCPAGQFCCIPAADVQAPPAGSTTDDGAAPAAPGRGELNDSRSYLINPLSGRTVPVIVGQTVAWLGRAAGAIFFLYLLWGGVQWMTAQGDQGKVQEAQKRIVAAIAGIAIVLLSYMIVASLITIIPQ